MAKKSLTSIVSQPQGSDELERQGLQIEAGIKQRLGSTYSVRRNNPETFGWTICQGDRECGGFVHFAKWVHIYGVCDAPSSDVEFVKVAVCGAIGSLGGAE